MRTLVRYASPATWSIFLGTVMTLVISANIPYPLHRVAGTFLLLWLAACALWCVAIWVSAAATEEGRRSAAPWVSGLAVAFKVFLVFALFGDAIRRLMGHSVDGRPLRADGKTHRTSAVPGDAWSGAVAPPPPLDAEPNLAGVDWVKLAGDEHASVAAFSRLSLELLAAGAPPELVAGAHQAALEEVQHAQLCFRVASLVSGRPCTAAPLRSAAAPLQLPASRAAHLARLAVESLRDGWLNEGAAARGVERLAAAARTPWLKHALQNVARQERGHAELAERIARWCASSAAQG